MEPTIEIPNNQQWQCGSCGDPMEVGPVTLSYMGNEFTINLPRCPRCQMIFIPEELVLGKMAEVERLLEDK